MWIYLCFTTVTDWLVFSLFADSLLLGMNESRQDKAKKRRSDNPFSFPRQKRSVRPRMFLSIDSDSDE